MDDLAPLSGRRSSPSDATVNGARNIIVAAAVNDRAILENCLRRSPDIAQGVLPLTVLEGYSSASKAYNEVLRKAPAGTLIIFAHQDVYLPADYGARLRHRIDELERTDPDWAVLGLSGRRADGKFAGKVWSTAAKMVQQSDFPFPVRVVTLDELLLVVKAGTGLLFDEQLPGFHMYAADIVQIGLSLGRNSYVIDAPAVHHDKPVIHLDKTYRRSYRYLRKKWWDRLPIPNLIAPLTRSRFTLYEYDLRFRYLQRGARRRTVPTANPSEIARTLGWE